MRPAGRTQQSVVHRPVGRGFDADLHSADKEDASKDAGATTIGSGMGGCTVADSFLG
jgi:hypothetical protein